MEDGDTESENASRVIQDFVFLCRKIGSINGYFCRYIINPYVYLIEVNNCILSVQYVFFYFRWICLVYYLLRIIVISIEQDIWRS